MRENGAFLKGMRKNGACFNYNMKKIVCMKNEENGVRGIGQPHHVTKIGPFINSVLTWEQDEAYCTVF